MPRWLWIVIGLLFFYNVFVKEEPKHTSNYKPTYTPTYQAPITFGKYTCTSDCSGHEAGYEWAEVNGIDDPDDCSGNSQSFIEGCREYAEENQ
jgi:hypothetical protein